MPALYKEWLWKAKRSLAAKVLLKPQPKPVVFAGPNSALELCATIGQFGLKSVLVATDKPLRDIGVADPIVAALAEHGVSAHIYDGVLPDPTQKAVDDGLAVLREKQCEGVLALGGGSSIDAAKAIALAAGNNCDAAGVVGIQQCKQPALPFFAIPTTAGTGSEATFIAVISDNESHQKGAVIDSKIIPKAAALDPEIMKGLPAHITAATGMDALTHAIESYIGVWETEETNFYGLAACKLIFENLEEACKNGSNLAAREAMAMASFYGGLAITNALVGYVHAVSHNLGAKYGVPHGLGNAMVLPHVLELLKQDASAKMAEIAVYCDMGDRSEGDSALAQKLIDRIWALNEAIEIPKTTDVIKAEDIDTLVDLAIAEGSGYPTPRYFERAEVVGILNNLRAA